MIAAACATLSTTALAQVVVRVGPPLPRVEVVPAARAGYLWTPGNWAWRGNRQSGPTESGCASAAATSIGS